MGKIDDTGQGMPGAPCGKYTSNPSGRLFLVFRSIMYCALGTSTYLCPTNQKSRPGLFKIMYKIYIQNTPLFIVATHQIPDTGITNSLNTPVAPYVGKKKLFLQYYDMLHKNKKVEAVVLHHANLDFIWTDFLDMFTLQEAAGGLVQNPAQELLVFYRRGSWDMPKGKIDPGETPEQAAVREVQEETGLKQLDLGAFITHSYHTFEQKDRRILKKNLVVCHENHGHPTHPANRRGY